LLAAVTVYACERGATHRADIGVAPWNARAPKEAEMLGTTYANPDLLRIRMEYLEMPGLCLTSCQAGRLWNLDRSTIDAIFSALVQQEFLTQTKDGAYIISAASRPFLPQRSRPRRAD
jgi:hypothetical protein